MIATAVNFRPLCGPAYRSGDLTRLSRGDAEWLRDDRGIRTFIDLRSDEEAYAAPEPKALMTACITWCRFPIGRFDDRTLRGAAPGPEAYASYYYELLTAGAERFIAILEALERLAAAPFVFGCFAGKDRTGVLAALLLSIAGCEVAEIIRDYSESGPQLLSAIDHFEAKWKGRRLSRDAYAERLRTPPRTMELFLSRAAIAGGLIAVLRQRGLTERTVAVLRERLTESRRIAS